MKGKILAPLIGLAILGSFFIPSHASDTYNNHNRFLRWRVNNEYVLSVQNADPFYGSTVQLEVKDDTNRLAQRWQYNPLSGQIIGMNDFCLGVGGQYEIMLKNCAETETHTLWNFDEYGRLVGSVNVTGEREARCLEGTEVNNEVEMRYVECSDSPTQRFELEGAVNTEKYTDILLYNDGQQQDSLFNAITNNQNLETLRDIIQILGSEQNLRNESLTILAPTDDAFAALGEETLTKVLAPENRDLLNEIIAHHVTPAISYQSLLEQGGIVNVAGDHLQIIDGRINGNSGFIDTDITSRNGFVHTIDAVLLSQETKNKIAKL